MPGLDGVAAEELCALLGLPAVRLYATVESTLDVAHRLAGDGAPAGTLVLADEQTRGRGRSGRAWESAAGEGLWITIVERPGASTSLRVLTLRLGLALARALEPFTDDAIGLKWPNDLRLGFRKLGGVLVEARWRGSSPEWLAVGVGINVISPAAVAHGIGMRNGVARIAALSAVVPALRAAAAVGSDELDDAELRAFDERDIARGRRCEQPARGIVRGITRGGELVVATGGGSVAFSSGSLVLAEES